MCKKHKKFCATLNYIENVLILASTITGCISTSPFASLIDILSSAIGLKICAKAAGIKNFKSLIKKKTKKHGKIVLLAKSKIDNIEVLISETFIDSNISHDEFVLINNVLKEYEEMKQEIKNCKT